MFEVLWRGGVFLFLTLVVYLVCEWFVRREEEEKRQRTERRTHS